MNKNFEGEIQSLKDILKSREMRVEYQKQLLNKYKNTIISYKLNIPGPIKYNSIIKKIFDEGLKILKEKLNEIGVKKLEDKVIYKNSGPEYFIVLDISPYIIKKLTIHIEEEHALGRIYDFDVLNEKGEQISREELGKSRRKCLLCEKNAAECGRARGHEVKELIEKIESMAREYFN